MTWPLFSGQKNETGVCVGSCDVGKSAETTSCTKDGMSGDAVVRGIPGSETSETVVGRAPLTSEINDVRSPGRFVDRELPISDSNEDNSPGRVVGTVPPTSDNSEDGTAPLVVDVKGSPGREILAPEEAVGKRPLVMLPTPGVDDVNKGSVVQVIPGVVRLAYMPV